MKASLEPDTYNNHKGQFDDGCAGQDEPDPGTGKTRRIYPGSCNWKSILRFGSANIDCTDDDILPSTNFVRFKATTKIEKGEHWIQFGGITNPLSFQPTQNFRMLTQDKD